MLLLLAFGFECGPRFRGSDFSWDGVYGRKYGAATVPRVSFHSKYSLCFQEIILMGHDVIDPVTFNLNSQCQRQHQFPSDRASFYFLPRPPGPHHLVDDENFPGLASAVRVQQCMTVLGNNPVAQHLGNFAVPPWGTATAGAEKEQQDPRTRRSSSAPGSSMVASLRGKGAGDGGDEDGRGSAGGMGRNEGSGSSAPSSDSFTSVARNGAKISPLKVRPVWSVFGERPTRAWPAAVYWWRGSAPSCPPSIQCLDMFVY